MNNVIVWRNERERTLYKIAETLTGGRVPVTKRTALLIDGCCVSGQVVKKIQSSIKEIQRFLPTIEKTRIQLEERNQIVASAFKTIIPSRYGEIRKDENGKKYCTVIDVALEQTRNKRNSDWKILIQTKYLESEQEKHINIIEKIFRDLIADNFNVERPDKGNCTQTMVCSIDGQKHENKPIIRTGILYLKTKIYI